MREKLEIKLKKINKYHYLLLVTMMFSALLLLYMATLKESMHIDEYLTYGLANSEDANNKIQPEYGVRLNAADVFDKFFYADNFSLKNVWKNQGNDVHPPFFYICVHIFSLFTHNFMALKNGILLNIIFHIINIGLVWFVLKKLLSNDCLAGLGSILYAFSPAILGNVLFIRMYVMVSIFILCLTAAFVEELNKSNKKAFYIKLGIISVAGTLTHYYFLIYLFFCCMVWGIYILIKRRWKELAVFLITMAAAGGVSIAVFPYMLLHIFVGYRGEESFENFMSESVFIKDIKVFWGAIDNIFGGLLLAVLIAFILYILLVGYLMAGKGIKEKQENIVKYTIVCLPCILYVLTIARIAVLASSRYIAPIYAICIILLMVLFDKLTSYMTDVKLKYIAAILMISILLNNSYNTYTWPELRLEAGECIKEARKYGINNDCIYVMSISWHSFTAYQEFIQYQNMTFIRDYQLDELLYTEDYSNYDHVVMYFDKTVGENNIDSILAKMIEINPKLDSYEMMHEWSYNTAYYLE